jgi:adenine-specific DNA-methyltransferase
MIPDMLVTNRMGLDTEGVLFHGPAIHSVLFKDKSKNEDINFYLGILNSKIFWFFIKNTSTALRGDAYRLTPEFLNPFCFPKIENNKESSKKIIVLVTECCL